MDMCPNMMALTTSGCGFQSAFAARHFAHLFGWHPNAPGKPDDARTARVHHAKMRRFWSAVEELSVLDCRCGLFWRLCPTAHAIHAAGGTGGWVAPRQPHEIEAELASDFVLTLLAEAEAATGEALKRAGPLATVSFGKAGGDALRLAFAKTLVRWRGAHGLGATLKAEEAAKALVVQLEDRQAVLERELELEEQLAMMAALAASLPGGAAAGLQPAGPGSAGRLLPAVRKQLAGARGRVAAAQAREVLVNAVLRRIDLDDAVGREVLSGCAPPGTPEQHAPPGCCVWAGVT